MSFTGNSFQWNPNSPVLQATTPFILNNNTVSASYNIPLNYNCISAGPITVSTGVSVTIPSGSRWVIL
jgi:Tol biopolymer transport system component